VNLIVLGLLGSGIGFGAWLVARGGTPPRRSLAETRIALETIGTPAATRSARWDWDPRLGTRALKAVVRVGDRSGRRNQLLGIVDRSSERHALSKLGLAIGAIAAAALSMVGLAAAGIALPIAPLVLLTVAVAAGAFLLPDVTLRDEARRRQRAFRHALSSYLDLVNVILAGGGGIETALHAAADAGDGFAFGAIRSSLDRARLTGRSPWATFAELGEELGINELRELSASVELAGSQGARIRASLAAKADTLRAHQIAETEAAADAATERMTIPVAVLLLGFLLFIAYPAVQQITTVTNPAP
jgi:Flp pilus assembly protein TadB